MIDKETKYELRSTEVQQVLKSKPNFLIYWGSSGILLLLIFCALYFNRIKVPENKTFPILIYFTPSDTLTHKEQRLNIKLLTNENRELKPLQKGRIEIANSSKSIPIEIVAINNDQVIASIKKDYNKNEWVHNKTDTLFAQMKIEVRYIKALSFIK